MQQAPWTPHNIAQHVGETRYSDWFLIDQQRINGFGEVTEDLDPHHVDPEFCSEHSPFGRPISFGFLTLSLLTPMLYHVFQYPLDGGVDDGTPLNYGFQRVRFVAPVPVDSRVRGRFTVNEVSERSPGQQLTMFDCVVEIKGEDRPALTALWESLWVRPV